MISEEIKRANKTARHAGVVGKNAIVPRIVANRFTSAAQKQRVSILDFGCGPHMLHVYDLRGKGFDVHGYDFGDNFSASRMFSPFLDDEVFDVVYASNVFNTHSSKQMSYEALHLMGTCADPSYGKEAKLILNLPMKPNLFWKEWREFQDFLFEQCGEAAVTKLKIKGHHVWEIDFNTFLLNE